MISTGSFLTEMDATEKQQTIAEKFARVWEMKNAKAARAGGVSLMALSLAACGSSSTTTETAGGGDAGGEQEQEQVEAQSLAMEAGIDTISGGAGDDTFTGILSATAANVTLSNLDTVNGGDGTDTLAILDESGGEAVPASLTLNSVEAITVRSAGATTVDASGYDSVTSLSVTQAAGAIALTAAATQTVSVAGNTTGATDVAGGLNVTIVDAVADTAINVGESGAGTTNAAGAISVTDSAQGTGAITIDGGTTVDVVSVGTTGAIDVGANTAASGAVNVSHTGAVATDSNDVTLGAIGVTGGTTVNVTQAANANMDVAAEFTTGTTITQSAVTVTADASTTSVSVSQTASQAEALYAAAVDGVKQTEVVTFVAMAAGETTVVNGLTFTASKALTAEEVAQAFANLTEDDTQTASGPVSNGVFTGGSTTNPFTTGPASGATVTVTEVTAGAGNNVAVSDTAAAGNVAAAAGVTATAAVTAVTGALGVINGVVTIDDTAANTITTVTVDGYDDSTIGTTGVASTLGSLESVTLKNSGGDAAGEQDATMTIDAAGVTTLALNVDNVQGTVDIDGATDGSITTLNLTASGTGSAFGLEMDGVTTLNVTANADLDIGTGSDTSALTTVVASGTGALDLGDISATATSVTQNGSGAVTVTVDGSSASVTTGGGADSVTVDVDAITEDLVLGAGDDTLVLNGDSTTVPAGTVDGGADTDTVSMTIASAAAYDDNAAFRNAISNFERVLISDTAGDNDGTEDTVTIDVEALGFSYVTTNGTTADTATAANADILVLDNMASGGTMELVAAAAAANTEITVNVKNAATGASDSLNLIVSANATVNAGTITADDVETMALTFTDVLVDANDDGTDDSDATHVMVLDADSVTSLTVGGDDVTLDTNSTVLTEVNAATLVGGLEYTADGAAAGTVVTGGLGGDTLTASGSNDTLNGGAGADTLTGANLSTLTGGEGVDTFVVNIPTNVNSYSTVTDIETGDIIQLTAGETFVSTAITLAATAVFQDYTNAAVNQLATDDEDAAWFQYDGNTFVVINDDQTDAVDADFENGTDAILMISGLVDLSAASYNETDGTLEIA